MSYASIAKRNMGRQPTVAAAPAVQKVVKVEPKKVSISSKNPIADLEKLIKENERKLAEVRKDQAEFNRICGINDTDIQKKIVSYFSPSSFR